MERFEYLHEFLGIPGVFVRGRGRPAGSATGARDRMIVGGKVKDSTKNWTEKQ